jgi:hypothetical protein
MMMVGHEFHPEDKIDRVAEKKHYRPRMNADSEEQEPFFDLCLSAFISGQ